MERLRSVKLSALFLIGIITYAAFIVSKVYVPEMPGAAAARTALLFIYQLLLSLPFALFTAWLFIRLERPPLLKWSALVLLVGAAAALLFELCATVLLPSAYTGGSRGAIMLMRAFSIAETVSWLVFCVGTILFSIPFARHPESLLRLPAPIAAIMALLGAALMLVAWNDGLVIALRTVFVLAPMMLMLLLIFIRQKRAGRRARREERIAEEVEYDG